MAKAIEEALERAEAAERGLAIEGKGGDTGQRLASGSFYTPADVVDHFWREYASFHTISSAADFRAHLRKVTFVEPSAGAGIFLFGLMKVLLSSGCEARDLRQLRFVSVDINGKAVDFVREQIRQLELETGIVFEGVETVASDFLGCSFSPDAHLSFIGNPPYVRNRPASRWKNLYADFIEHMLDVPAAGKSLSLIVPISIAFSRDYASLRRRLLQLPAVRLESFDNIPDCLFKAGKPGHTNTNQANSQRCCILTVAADGPSVRESTSLQRWSRGDREAFLQGSPTYVRFTDYSFDSQIPRPSQPWILPYLGAHGDDLTIGEICGAGPHILTVAGVARNFIGVREPTTVDSGVVSLRFASDVHFAWALQIICSPIFYEYWRSLGDGFHVTRSDLLRFPISPRLLSACNAGADRALSIWRRRSDFARSKLNAGKEVVSYDFRAEFADLLDAVFADGTQVVIERPIITPARQAYLPGLTVPAE